MICTKACKCGHQVIATTADEAQNAMDAHVEYEKAQGQGAGVQDSAGPDAEAEGRSASQSDEPALPEA